MRASSFQREAAEGSESVDTDGSADEALSDTADDTDTTERTECTDNADRGEGY